MVGLPRSMDALLVDISQQLIKGNAETEGKDSVCVQCMYRVV